MSDLAFIPNHEVRRIPRGWQHPVDRGMPVPMFPHDYVAYVDGAYLERMPAPGEDYEIVAYERCSEGTPESPAFPDTPQGRRDLVVWCSEQCTTYGSHTAGVEAWAAILFGCATVDLDGTVKAS